MREKFRADRDHEPIGDPELARALEEEEDAAEQLLEQRTVVGIVVRMRVEATELEVGAHGQASRVGEERDLRLPLEGGIAQGLRREEIAEGRELSLTEPRQVEGVGRGAHPRHVERVILDRSEPGLLIGADPRLIALGVEAVLVDGLAELASLEELRVHDASQVGRVLDAACSGRRRRSPRSRRCRASRSAARDREPPPRARATTGSPERAVHSTSG